jgi:hypothetical protein
MIAIYRNHDSTSARLAALTAPVIRAYADRHGYDFLDTYIAWPKVMLGEPFTRLRSFLKTYDMILAMDSDAVIANLEIPIPDRQVIGKGAVLADEHLGGSPLNTGVWLWNAGPAANWLLDMLILIAPMYEHHQWIYQQAIIDLLQGQWGEVNKRLAEQVIGIVPAEQMNSHPENRPDGEKTPPGPWIYQPGHWIVHFLTGSTEQKFACVRRFLLTCKT